MSDIRLFQPAMVAAIALLLGSAAGAALAQSQDQTFAEPVDKRLDRLEKQLREVRAIVLQAHATGAPVEIKEAGPDPQVLAVTSRLDDVDQTLRGLTGQIEGLQHDLGVARARADSAKADTASLADRLDKVEHQLAVLAPAAPPQDGPQAPDSDGGLAGQANQTGSPPANGPADPKAAYASARQLLLDGDYKAASSAFQDYVDRFGDTANARPARYWLAETDYIQGDFAGAAKAYLGAIRGWPDTPWAPDAVVKLSLSLVQLDQAKQACAALTEFDRRYPHASAAAQDRAAAARQKAGCGH